MCVIGAASRGNRGLNHPKEGGGIILGQAGLDTLLEESLQNGMF